MMLYLFTFSTTYWKANINETQNDEIGYATIGGDVGNACLCG